MGDRRPLDAQTDRMPLSRRIRILRHRTARWFLPPVRPTGLDTPDEPPRVRVLPLRRPTPSN